MKILEGEEIATKSTEAMKVQSSLWDAESPCPEICVSERRPQNEVPLCDLGHQGSIWTLAHTRWNTECSGLEFVCLGLYLHLFLIYYNQTAHLWRVERVSESIFPCVKSL